MNNELMKNADLKVNIDIGSPAAVGIAAVAVAGFCFCICFGMQLGYTANLGKLSFTPEHTSFTYSISKSADGSLPPSAFCCV